MLLYLCWSYFTTTWHKHIYTDQHASVWHFFFKYQYKQTLSFAFPIAFSTFCHTFTYRRDHNRSLNGKYLLKYISTDVCAYVRVYIWFNWKFCAIIWFKAAWNLWLTNVLMTKAMKLSDLHCFWPNANVIVASKLLLKKVYKIPLLTRRNVTTVTKQNYRNQSLGMLRGFIHI